MIESVEAKRLAWRVSSATAALLMMLGLHASTSAIARPVTVSDLLTGSHPEDWRQPDPDNTLYLQLSGGRVAGQEREFLFAGACEQRA